MSGEGDEVARGIPGEEDLGTWEFEIFIRFLFVLVVVWEIGRAHV